MSAPSSASSSIPPSSARTSGGTGLGAGTERVTRAKGLGRMMLARKDDVGPREIRKSWGLGGEQHCMLLLALQPA